MECIQRLSNERMEIFPRLIAGAGHGKTVTRQRDRHVAIRGLERVHLPVHLGPLRPPETNRELKDLALLVNRELADYKLLKFGRRLGFDYQKPRKPHLKRNLD